MPPSLQPAARYAQCPFGVKSTVSSLCQRLPVCPDQRTFSALAGMSQWCQRRSFRNRACRAFPLGRRRLDAGAAGIVPTSSKRLRLAASALRPVRTAARPMRLTEPQYSKATPATLGGASEIDADRDATAFQFGKGSCVRV
jgi:hypothetical protein